MTPVKQRNPALTIVLVVLAGLLVLCCAGAVIGGLVFYHAATDVGPAQSATRSFVRDLESGDATDAYSRLCPSTKKAFPPAVFESLVQSQPRITGYRVVSGSVNNVNGSSTATVVVDLHLASGRTERHSFLLTKDGGKWLVCGDPY